MSMVRADARNNGLEDLWYEYARPNKAVQRTLVTWIFQLPASVKNSQRNDDEICKIETIPAAQFLTFRSPGFQLPSTMTLQTTSVGHGSADLCR